MLRTRLAVPALAAALLLVPAASVAAKERKLTRSDSGETVHLHKGDVLRVSLRETPGTGYGWRTAKRPAKAILHARTNKFVVDPQDPNGPSIGGPGTRVFRWSAVGVGTTSLRISLYAPGSKKASKSFRLTVKVSSAQH